MSNRKSNKEILYDRQNGRCCWCGKAMAFYGCTWEHIIPLSLGGPDTFENKALAHEACNKDRRSEVTRKPHPSFLFDFVRAVLERNGAYQCAHGLRPPPSRDFGPQRGITEDHGELYGLN